MSFTRKAKDEILNSKLFDKPSVSFVSAIAHTAGSLHFDSDGLGFEITSENKQLMQKTNKFIKELYGAEQRIRCDDTISPNRKNVYIVKCTGVDASNILEQLRIIDKSETLEIVFGIEEGIFNSELDEKMYIIGCFLGCGLVSVPSASRGGYHLEFAFNNDIMAEDFASLLLRTGFNPKFAKRKSKYLVYFKEKDVIIDLLCFMDAMTSVLAINDIVITRETNNMVNRQTNCQMANIGKVVATATKQIEAIEYISQVIGLESLDVKLKEMAVLRKGNGDVGLEELGQMADPPISKSGVNHRLRKLVKIAEELKLKEESNN